MTAGAVNARFSVAMECGASEGEGSGPVQVGWLFAERRSAMIYAAPRRVRGDGEPRRHAKSAAACPAILNLESRLFEVTCPFDLALDYCETEFGEPAVRESSGPMATLREGALDTLVAMSPREEWRHPDRPVLQLLLPYVFLADEPVHMAQLPPFLHWPEEPPPGLMLAGRFPINVWPRTLTWAFEWRDPSRQLRLRRGEPLFYLQFETAPQSRPVQLVEAEMTAELSGYLEQIAGVVNYVGRTFSLFREAEARRPARLLEPARRK